MNSKEFINLVKDGAIKAQQEHGVLASLTIAQGILESGWGKYAPGNNLFGIKWTNGCGYNKQLRRTREVYGGKEVYINDYFRAYNSLADSVYDHAQFLIVNSRYANLLWKTDYKEVCTLIQRDGYATALNYTKLLIQIIEENQLYQYDNISIKPIIKEVRKVKNLVLISNSVDERAGKYLADYLQCPILDAGIPFDYSVVENVYGVGGTPTTNGIVGWTSFAKKIICGVNRYETCQKVLDFIKNGGK